MTNQNKRPVGILLGIGIFLIPGIFAWFTLRKGYSSLVRIVSFSWLVIGLYGAYPMIKKKAEEIPMFFGFFPEHVQAQQCLTVSRFLSENEAPIWREASEKRISYWLKNQSGCLDSMECMQQRQALSSFVELRAAPDENNVSRDIIKKWMNSDYCQNLVASHQNILSNQKQAAPQMPEPKPEPVKSDPFRIKLYFEKMGDGNDVYEAVDFQKDKVASFCYDIEELNKIKLEGASDKNVKLIVTNNDQIVFEKDNLSIDTNTIFYNKDIKIEPGPARLEIKVLQDSGVIFQGNVESQGCT